MIVNNLIKKSAIAMFSSIGIVACIIYHNVPSLVIFLCFCVYSIVERIRKKRKQKQVWYYFNYRQYPSVECCCKDCIYFTNVVHHADGRKVDLCEVHNRHMYTDSFCFSSKKGDDAE